MLFVYRYQPCTLLSDCSVTYPPPPPPPPPPPHSYVHAGPPLPPHPTMTLLNATTLQLNWNKPFTWTAVADILNYTVRMYNSSGDQWRNWTVGPFVNAIAVVKEGGMVDQCAELSFDVSATNVVGESRILTVSGGFPIGEPTQ